MVKVNIVIKAAHRRFTNIGKRVKSHTHIGPTWEIIASTRSLEKTYGKQWDVRWVNDDDNKKDETIASRLT